MIENVISELKAFRDNVDIEFEHWFNFAVKLGEEVNTTLSVPRLAKAGVDSDQTLKMMVLYPVIWEASLFQSWRCKFSARISPER